MRAEQHQPAYSPVEEYGSLEISIRRDERVRSISDPVPTSTDSVWVERVKVVVVLLLLSVAIALGIKAIQDDWIDHFEDFANANRLLASIVIVLLFVPTSLLFVPIDGPLYLVAGFMYGFLPGALLCWLGYNIGSWVGFIVGRYMFRDWFIRRTRSNKFISAIRSAVQHNAFLLVVLLQVAPIMPYSVVCYFFGTSDCPFSAYACGTAIGVIPTALVFSFVGSSMETIAEAAQGKTVVATNPFHRSGGGGSATSGGGGASGVGGSGGEGTNNAQDAAWYFYWVSAAVGLVALIVITVLAKRELDAIVAEATVQNEAAERAQADSVGGGSALRSTPGSGERRNGAGEQRAFSGAMEPEGAGGLNGKGILPPTRDGGETPTHVRVESWPFAKQPR